MKLRTLIGVLVLLIFVILVFAVQRFISKRLDPRAIEKQISKFVGLDVHASKLHVERSGRVVLSQVVISQAGLKIGSVKEIEAQINLWDLLKRRLNITSITLQFPTFKLNSSSFRALSKFLSNRREVTPKILLSVHHGAFSFVEENHRNVAFHEIQGNIHFSPNRIPMAIDFQDENGREYQFSGTMTQSIVSLQLKVLNRSEKLPPLMVSGEINANNGIVHVHSNLNGNPLFQLAKLGGISIPSVRGEFYGTTHLEGKFGKPSIDFSGTVKHLVLSNHQFGDLPLTLKAFYTKRGYALQTHVAQLPLSHVLNRGIQGLLMLNARLTVNGVAFPPVYVDFDLTNVSVNQRNFSEIRGRGVYYKSILQLESLSFPLSPPVYLHGSFNVSTNQCQLLGALQGNSIVELIRFAGGNMSDVDGKLFGPIVLEGLAVSPRARFDGEVTQLFYRGMSLGRGRLTLRASSQVLDGKLLFDTPLKVVGNSPLNDLLKSVPNVGNVLSQIVTNLSVTGIVIRGTPEHPAITPMLSQVTIQQQSSKQNPINDILRQILR